MTASITRNIWHRRKAVATGKTSTSSRLAREPTGIFVAPPPGRGVSFPSLYIRPDIPRPFTGFMGHPFQTFNHSDPLLIMLYFVLYLASNAIPLKNSISLG